MTDSITDRNQYCPACGALNNCSLADPRSATEACWCFSVNIEPQLLEALPSEWSEEACLCPRCAGVLEQLPALATQKR